MPTTSSSDGVVVDYLRLGGSGPRLLFVHATGFCATVWRPMADVLSERFDCWALDVRGHGRSNPPADETFDWAGTADDVLAVVDDLGGDGPWFGVGHSMGGASLLLAEERRPGTFAGIWAYEPVVFPSDGTTVPPDRDPGNHLADGAARRRATFASRQAAFDNYASKPPMDVFDPRALEGYLERGLVDDPDPDAPVGGVRLACEPAVEAQVYRMGGRHTAWSHLGEVGAPVTIVAGDTSIPGPAVFAAQVADRLPAGRLESHADLGHFGPMQAPDRMAASVVAAVLDAAGRG
ncbi:MAG TPA: alpha/beta hydrolase [Microthrixaceae bacterium]|nr:alpha/beta hydrolase [Microthrixaceae bacterium]